MQAPQTENIVPAEQASQIEKIEQARQVLQKTNLRVVLEALADMIEKTGEYYEMLGKLDKEYGKVMEALKVYGNLPNVWEILRQKADSKTIATLFEVSVRLQIMAADIQRWQALSPDEKVNLGKGMQEIAKIYRGLVRETIKGS